MLKGFIAAAMVIIVGTPAFAQDQPPSQIGESRVRGQNVQISLMETALVAAIRSGALDLVNQLTKTTQATARGLLLGDPQATGFKLQEYGYFFYLRVPGMRGSVLLSSALVQRYRAPVQPQPGQAQATNVADSAVSAPPTASPVDVLSDSDAAYVRSIRVAVIEAMLENSGGLRIPSDQVLTVAARKDTEPNPLDPSDEVRTMTFSVKGSDLEAYRQGRLTLDQAKNLVEVRED